MPDCYNCGLPRQLGALRKPVYERCDPTRPPAHESKIPTALKTCWTCPKCGPNHPWNGLHLPKDK